jgi:two-component system LytT family sensor kinase
MNVGDNRALSFKAMSAIVAVFWIYAAITAMIYAYGFGGGLGVQGIRSPFVPWGIRLAHYAVLYPILLGFYWTSLRFGWRPWWRVVPIQLVLGVVFAALAPTTLLGVTYAIGGVEAVVDSQDPAAIVGGLREYLGTIGLAVITDFFIRYGFGLALVTGADLYKQARDSEIRAAALEREWSKARLQALRMQLSPHALFNLLNLIRGQIGWDPPAAQKTVVMLADLLRRLLRAADRDFVPLRDELEFARLYLELQRQRFPDRLTVVRPTAGDLADVFVPSLILQPLIENAVTHGLEGHDAPIDVTVDVARQGDRLALSVRNDAPGASRVPSGGVGLENVRERLAVHFGERGTLESGMVSREHWVARVEIPLLRDEPVVQGADGRALAETRA